MIYKVKTVLLVCVLFSIDFMHAQISKDSEMFKTLRGKDSLLFEVGFNQCNLEMMEALVMDDIEFYHDKDGITKSKRKFMNSVRENLCRSGKNVSKRFLDKTSLEVFPLYDGSTLYGAIQNGTHSFGQTKANFSHLWLVEENEWKISRVMSYNHHLEEPVLKTNFVDVPVNELEKYVGIYEFSPEFVLTVRIKDGRLYGGSQGQEVAINCYQKHKFIDDEQTHDLEFIIDQKGNVASLLMKGSGMEMTASKKK